MRVKIKSFDEIFKTLRPIENSYYTEYNIFTLGDGAVLR